MIVCSCNVLSCHQIKGTIAPDGTGPRTAGEAYDCLGCSPDCGRCARTIRAIMREAGAGSSCSVCPLNACTHHAETPAEMMIAAE